MTYAIDPKLFELMAHQAQDYAIFLLDVDGHIMSWNAGAVAIKQYTASEIIGKHFSVFYMPSDNERGWPAQELTLAKSEGRFEDEGWRVRKDGTRFWANVVITALRDESGALLAFSKITRDLTARKKEEEILRESEERFRLLVDGVLDYAIYLMNPEGIVISWNEGARRIKGFDATEVIGQHFSRFYEQADIDLGKPWAELAIARQSGRAEDEGWRIRKDGSRFWARVIVTALYDENGSLRGFAKITQDLTQRRHSEALENSAKELNNFIAILAHELRNPLAPIRQAAELVRNAPHNDATRRMAVDVIERQSALLARIVDDLLDVNRITRGTMSVHLERVPIAQVITRAIETIQPLLDAAKHTLVVDVPKEALYVQADELRLTQAYVNILVNAIRYTNPGGTISIRAYRPEGASARQVCTSIRDNGQGIDPTLLPSIFNMFVQGQDKLKRGASGLGVGLALTRGIVELHHGTVEAISAGVGSGAEFILSLPLSEEGSQKRERKGRLAAQFKTPSKRVLVVDDNVDAAQILGSLLQSHGHDVVSVYSGADALEAFDSFRPEFVLLDIGMAGMNGLEVVRRMRGRNRRPSPQIVAVTGWGKLDDEQRSREAGFDAHLVKPVGEAQLLDLLAAPA